MTTRSAELEAITLRWINALAVCDPDLIANLFSESTPPHYCGTDVNEVWSGDLLRDSYPEHMSDAPKGSYVVEGAVTAHETHPGTSGWAFWEGQMHIPATDRTVHLRVTLVYGCFKGIWKVAHVHCSNPTPNAETYGWVHTKMDAMLSQLQEQGFTFDQPSLSTIMFTDIANSSALAQVHGDISWTRMIRAHLDVVTRHVEQAGGTLIKSLGDGTMSVFPEPQDAVSAACTIQQDHEDADSFQRLGVRVGLHTGSVVHTDDDYFGTVVNAAARIAAAAGPGEIRISEDLKKQLDDETATDDPITMKLKGLEGAYTLHRVVRS